MLVIGLTGPSGAGKSLVATQFASFGIPVLDADAIYRELLVPPSECLSELTVQFGERILLPDGTLDRRTLGGIVFTNPEALEQLNKIAHRHVLAETRRRLRQLRDADFPAAVFDAPQLFESGANRDCNLIVSVLAPEEIRLHRILLRDGISEQAAIERMHAQKSEQFFRTHSDYIIENDLNPEATLPQIKAILTESGVISP